MPRYINENEIYALFNRRGQASLHVGDIDVLPRVDVVEVVHGRWVVEYPSGLFLGRCSSCKTLGNLDWHYCPNCGAKMDEKEKHYDD